MSNRRDLDFLADILEAVRRADEYVGDVDYETFVNDTKTQDAVIRTIEIIGEATKHLSSDLRDSHPDVPWKSMAGMRDKLIHHYFGVNIDIVWQIAVSELPGLSIKVEQILKQKK
jgi:uncharacterized protein with HEPN domain